MDIEKANMKETERSVAWNKVKPLRIEDSDDCTSTNSVQLEGGIDNIKDASKIVTGTCCFVGILGVIFLFISFATAESDSFFKYGGFNLSAC